MAPAAPFFTPDRLLVFFENQPHIQAQVKPEAETTINKNPSTSA